MAQDSARKSRVTLLFRMHKVKAVYWVSAWIQVKNLGAPNFLKLFKDSQLQFKLVSSRFCLKLLRPSEGALRQELDQTNSWLSIRQIKFSCNNSKLTSAWMVQGLEQDKIRSILLLRLYKITKIKDTHLSGANFQRTQLFSPIFLKLIRIWIW